MALGRLLESVSAMRSCLLLPIIFLKISLAAVARDTIFTLYTEPKVNWQTALEFCRVQGQELVRVTSQAEHDFLKSLGKDQGAWHSELNDGSWSSLFDLDPTSPDTGYHWYFLDPASCQPLTEGSWTNWKSADELDHSALCVALVWDMDFVWERKQCDKEQKGIICRREGEICNDYKESQDKAVKMSSSELRERSNVTSEKGCQEACTKEEIVSTVSCYAAEWVNEGQCILHIAQGPFADADLEPKLTIGVTKSSLFLRSCFKPALIKTDFQIHELLFNPRCPNTSEIIAETTTTTSSTATTTTTTPSTTTTTTTATTTTKPSTATTTATATTTSPRTTSTTAIMMANKESSSETPTPPPPPATTLKERAESTGTTTTTTTKPTTASTTSFTTALSMAPKTSTSSINTTTSEILNTTTSEILNKATSEILNTTTSEILNTTTSEILNIATSEILNTATSEILNITTSDILNTATSEILNTATSEILNTATSEILNTTTSDILNTTTSDIPTTTSEILNTSTSEILNTSTSEILNTSTSEILDTTTSEILDTTTSEILDTTTSEILDTTTSEIFNPSTSAAPTTTLGVIHTSTSTTLTSPLPVTRTLRADSVDEDIQMDSSTQKTSPTDTISAPGSSATPGHESADEDIQTGSPPEKTSLTGTISAPGFSTTPGHTRRHAAILCPCRCAKKNHSLTAEQHKVLSQLMKTLTVDHKNTTSYKRKYTSAPDPRRSAQTIGYVGVVVLVMVVVVIVSIDATSLWCAGLKRVGPGREVAGKAEKSE